MDYQTLTLTIEGPIATVALNRPDVINAMNIDMFLEVGHVFDHLNDVPAVRAIVLTGGESRHFTCGLDLKEAVALMGNMDRDPARIREQLLRKIKRMQNAFTAIEKTRAPVIAAIHGACAGAGVDMTSACDIRLATKDSWYSIKEVDVGIVADVGTLQRIRHLMPDGIVRELALTARKFEAQEAAHYGFVNHLYDDQPSVVAAARAMATEIAAKSPLAVIGTKNVLNHARDHSVQDGLDYVANWNSGMLLGEDLMKAATAFLTKQDPDFDDLFPDELADKI